MKWLIFFLLTIASTVTSSQNDYQFCFNFSTTNLSSADDANSCLNTSTNKFRVCDYTDKERNSSLLYNVANANDVISLLNQVNFTLCKLICNDDNEEKTNVGSSFPKIKQTSSSSSCYNTTCNFTNDPKKVLYSKGPCQHCGGSDHIIGHWSPILIMGLFCLIGNAVVIYQKLSIFIKKLNQAKEIQVYYAFVLSLSIADVLMGVYLVLISFEIKRKTTNDNAYFSDNTLCNFLGILSLLSSQVSLSVIVLISCFRLYGICFPYKTIKLKATICFIVIIWMFWIVFCIVPVINVEPLTTFFVPGIRNSDAFISDSTVSFADKVHLFQSLTSHIENNSNFFKVLNAINKYPTNTVILKAMERFGMLNLKTENWISVGFYTRQYYCSINMINNKYFTSLFDYTLFLIVYNLLSCCVIIIAYATILFNFAKHETKLFSCFVNAFTIRKSSGINNVPKKFKKILIAENEKLLRRITIIVVTDVVCWFSLCIVSLYLWKRFNGKKTEEVKAYLKVFSKFQLVFFCLMPINSVINPFIYSYQFWKSIFQKIRSKITDQT